jgi:hypothetical protein
MTILKHALLGSLRIVFLGTLKFALFAYSLFLCDTAFVGAVPEANSNATSEQAGPAAQKAAVGMAINRRPGAPSGGFAARAP